MEGDRPEPDPHSGTDTGWISLAKYCPFEHPYTPYSI